MPHISLGNDAPGIVSLFAYRPETAKPLCDLAEVLLRGPSSLTRGERELIASYVSKLNDCNFCTDSHAAFAAAQLPEGMTLVDQVRADPDAAPVSPKLHALLSIAAAVQRGGRTCAMRTSLRPARPVPPTWKSMTRSSSPPRSACTTGMWTGSRRLFPMTPPATRPWRNES